MDILDDILSSLRLSGGVVIDGEFSGDFCVRAQFTPDHCVPFFPMPDALISYHYVRSGEAIIEVEGMAPVRLQAGAVAILPRNDAHLLASRSGLPPADVSEISWVTAEGVHRVASGTPGPKTDVWCGFLGTSKNSDHPLLSALPPLLILNVVGGEAHWLESSMRFLAEENPSPEIVARLAELFLSQAIREYVDRLPAGSKGWLRGLVDPAVSKALSVIHTRYAEELDVEMLAREAGVSRTVLGERFGELIGEPPMRYCARWRMRTAANMLRDGKENTANIAYAVGFNSEAAFNRAFKREYGEPPVTWKRKIEEQERSARVPEQETAPAAKPMAPEQEIRSCEAADGTAIFYAVSGDGFPLVKAPNWITHLELDRTSPVWRGWFAECSADHRFIHGDMRGFGMSDWAPPKFDFEAMLGDLEAVADDAEAEQFDLLGISHGAALAIAYAARHPERVRKLVLVNSFACGWRVRANPEELSWRESLMEMNRREWSFRRSLFGEMFLTLYFPGAGQELIDWHNANFERLGPVDNMLEMIEIAADIDVREDLAKIKAPTLVLHSKQDGNAPLAAGHDVAEAIKGARLVELDSANHILVDSEPAWGQFTRELHDFLGGPDSKARRAPQVAKRVRDTRPNQLMVSGTPTSIHWLSHHIAGFMDASPDLSIELDPAPQLVDFARDPVDCGIRGLRTRPTDLHGEQLFRTDFTPACSPEFLAKHPELRTPADLADLPRITPGDPWWQDWWRHFGMTPPKSSRQGLEFGAQLLDGMAAMRGRGVALLTPLFWAEELASGELVCPFPERLDGGGIYWLVYPEERAEWPKIRRFSEWMHALCSDTQERVRIPA